MKTDFIKAHGLGNDFIIFDCGTGNIPNIGGDTAQHLCDRHFGIGADGVVILTPCRDARAYMRIINSDGSDAKMCGNAARCVARLFYEKDRLNEFTIDTPAGIKRMKVKAEDGNFISASVNIGRLRAVGRFDCVINGSGAEFMRVDAGNPHAVTYSIYPEENDFLKHGRMISSHPLFAEGTNVEFAKRDSDSHITLKVYERGAGVTLACGTGAAAAFFAGYKTGLLRNEAECELSGGTLRAAINENDEVIISGGAEIVYTGSVELPESEN